MWMMPLHLHVNQKSDYDIYMMMSEVVLKFPKMINSRHVKINGSPVSLTENSAVFRKTDVKKNSQILTNPLIVLPVFC